MWSFFGRQLLREVGKQVGPAAQLGRGLGNPSRELNGAEVYVDRIKKDFHLHDYADALALYNSDPAHWEKWYNPPPNDIEWKKAAVRDSAAAAGIPSRYNVFEHGFPEPDPSESFMPRQRGVGESGNNLLSPAVTGANGPFGTRGQFAPGSATSSQPLYETESFAPPVRPTQRNATSDKMPSRRLVGRIADRPATFNERFQTSQSAESPDELEAFRRKWLKEFLGR